MYNHYDDVTQATKEDLYHTMPLAINALGADDYKAIKDSTSSSNTESLLNKMGTFVTSWHYHLGLANSRLHWVYH